MAKQKDTAYRDLRNLLVMLCDALGQPPLSAKVRLCIEGVMDLLGEQDVAKRLASRDRLEAMMAELDGRLQ